MITEVAADCAVVNANGINIRYRLEGPADAPVVVLSASLGTDLSMWAAQVELLAQHYRVLRYDTRGHGGSDVPRGPYTLDQLGGDVVGLLDALGIARAHFCGISMGGIIGQWLGIHAPHRLLSLTIASTAARIGTREGWLDRAALVRRAGMAPVVEATPARWFTPGFVEYQPAAVARALAMLGACPTEGYASCCEALADADLRDTITHIRVPTLIIAGLHDPVTTPADADFIASRIGNARRADLAASHLSNIEAAHSFNDALLGSLMMRDSAKTLA
ncbi:3-oxoadipate enol-lactonase [Uliginosibacterium sp. sgz301328]|uniref:3-oxoadipate enol-lactonase n=1 Tax=Uliginosibacterium sp. sgz301328 TaxID=3243764 RepID=UPI00359EE3FF